MQDVARIVLAVDSEHLAQDVIDFLDRTGRATVVDAVRDPSAVAEVVLRERPDAVVGSPSLVPVGALNGSAFLAVATEESVRVLRQAVDAGARGFFVWPADRAELLRAAAGTAHEPTRTQKPGDVFAVLGSRGGAGATFVATHLAAALERRGRRTIVVDADASFGDLTWALGVPDGAEVRTLGDLEPVRDEISEEHVRNVLWEHPSGARALLAPAHGEAPGGPDRWRRLIEVCAGISEAVVVHLPRSVGALVREVAAASSRVLVVVSLDVFAFRDAKRVVEVVDGVAPRWDVVVNRASRGLVVPGDVERVFGRSALAVLPFDRSVSAAQDRGELVAPRSRAGRAVDRLASLLLEEA